MNGADAYDFNTPFTSDGGQSIRITKLKFYAHDFHLTDDDGATVAEFHDKIVLINAFAATNEFTLGDMDPGHIHNLELAIGLDSASSYGYPDQVTAPEPLNDADMTWMWSTEAGRMFVKMEGFVDQNGNNALDAGELFEFHGIGPDMTAVLSEDHIHEEVAGGTTVTLGLKVDVPTLFGGMVLPAIQHNDNAQVQTLMQNISTALAPL